jgi:hypothetical protein
MATVEAPEPARELAGGAGILIGRRARRGDRFEALGLLLGILVFVAVTVGAAPPT